MKDLINLLAQIINLDIFIGYGFYSILFVMVTFFLRNNKLLDKLDHAATRIVIFSGIFYLILFIIWFLIYPKIGNGKYWWGPYVQPLVWIFITQVLWIEKVRKLKIIRLILSVFFILTFERYVVLVTSFQVDYVSSSWGEMFSIEELLLGLSLKILFFIFIACIYYVISKKVIQEKRKIMLFFVYCSLFTIYLVSLKIVISQGSGQ